MLLSRISCISLLLTLVAIGCLSGRGLAADPVGIAQRDAPYATAAERRQRLLQVNSAGIALVTGWGIYKWDYFTRTPHAGSEGWFGNGTDDGGSDKLGHLYSTYLASHGLACLFEEWRFPRKEAALYGSLSSWLISGYMEFGDSFSKYGFSAEDLLFNTLGSALGCLLYLDANLAEKIDLRWEYGVNPTGGDLFTDYENTKVLLAVKLNGFERIRRGWLKHVELHLGYYTRGFDEHEPDRERNIYVGIGLNLTDFFRRRGWRKAAKVFNYLQLPYTYLPFEHDFNR